MVLKLPKLEINDALWAAFAHKKGKKAQMDRYRGNSNPTFAMDKILNHMFRDRDMTSV